MIDKARHPYVPPFGFRLCSEVTLKAIIAFLVKKEWFCLGIFIAGGEWNGWSDISVA